jgi:outer membrane immunogenic protein
MTLKKVGDNMLYNLMGTAALALGLSASVSAAADLIEPASVNDWAGFYAGIHAGRGLANSDLRFDEATGFSNSDIRDGFSTALDGQLAGAQLGYNYQTNSLFLGAEADYSWSGIEGTYRNQYIGGNYYFYADADVEWLASLRARVGFVVAKAAIYGTGGIAFAGTETRVTSNYSGSGITDSDSSTRTGWVLGGGVEAKLTSNMSARLEYLHYDFESESFFYRLDPESDAYDAFGDAYLDVDILRVGVNMLF